jgi:hypothetical protein
VPPDGIETARHARCTAANADSLPRRVSPGRRWVCAESTTIQRSRPARTSVAIQAAVTELSRPENPPSPATSAFSERIADAALLWLSTPTVPPPCEEA